MLRRYDSQIYAKKRISVAHEVKMLFSKSEVPRIKAYSWYSTCLQLGSFADPLQYLRLHPNYNITIATVFGNLNSVSKARIDWPSYIIITWISPLSTRRFLGRHRGPPRMEAGGRDYVVGDFLGRPCGKG